MSDALHDFRTPQFESRLATMREICEVLDQGGHHRLMAQLIEHEVRDSHMTINDARSILGLPPIDDSVLSESLRFPT